MSVLRWAMTGKLYGPCGCCIFGLLGAFFCFFGGGETFLSEGLVSFALRPYRGGGGSPGMRGKNNPAVVLSNSACCRLGCDGLVVGLKQARRKAGAEIGHAALGVAVC